MTSMNATSDDHDPVNITNMAAEVHDPDDTRLPTNITSDSVPSPEGRKRPIKVGAHQAAGDPEGDRATRPKMASLGTESVARPTPATLATTAEGSQPLQTPEGQAVSGTTGVALVERTSTNISTVPTCNATTATRRGTWQPTARRRAHAAYVGSRVTSPGTARSRHEVATGASTAK